MRQVPRYLLVGRGRLATHLAHYFKLKQISFDHWHRGMPTASLNASLTSATHILLAISDAAIEDFVTQHNLSPHQIPIHFSGSLVTSKAIGAHPLMTFSHDLYEEALYESIPFVLDHNAPYFSDLFPQLTNPHARLDQHKKARYHALCVLAGNFTCLLWAKLFKLFESDFNFKKEIAYPYLKKQMDNIIQSGGHALTGPLTRNDQATIDKNIDELSGDAYQAVYLAFLNAYRKECV